jgi:hypothetical protein
MKKAKFNLDEIEPKNYAVRCFIPALFCHAKNDTFVNQHHCKDLSEVYAGDKNVIYVEGNHNSSRPRYFRDSASIFFYNTLQCNRIKEISDDYNGFKHEIVENEENKNNNNEINNNDDFNFINENEDLIFQRILEQSLKEYEQKKSEGNADNENQINNNVNNNILINNKDNDNSDNSNIKNDNIINTNYIEDKQENNISNNIIHDNSINKENIIDCSDYFPNDSKIDSQINEPKKKENDKISDISKNSKKGLFDDLNPVPIQNHIKNDDFDINDS